MFLLQHLICYEPSGFLISQSDPFVEVFVLIRGKYIVKQMENLLLRIAFNEAKIEFVELMFTDDIQ